MNLLHSIYVHGAAVVPVFHKDPIFNFTPLFTFRPVSLVNTPKSVKVLYDIPFLSIRVFFKSKYKMA